MSNNLTKDSLDTNWVVHKFGGTSVANAERYRHVVNIVAAQPNHNGHTAIVVSAMAEVTDALLEVVELATWRDNAYLAALGEIKQRHLQTLASLGLSEEQRLALAEVLESDLKDIREVLRGTWLAKSCAEPIREFVSGHGEVWSAQFLNAILQARGLLSTWLDARQILVVETSEGTVDWQRSSSNLREWLSRDLTPYLVITGFVASTREGTATTLKRNGSDYSASIFGALLGAASITIWTDVDGILSADPKLVPDALVIRQLSYEEATEMAYFGAKVIHPRTMAPAISGGIPIWIKNTFNPDDPGTKISAASISALPVKGFASIANTALINIEGTGMIGVPGVAHRLFGALRDVNVSVVMISQASSEHSICFALPEAQAELARTTIETEFLAEIQRGEIQKVGVMRDCCILAAVGEGMIDHPGIAGKFFTALASARVNVRAIAQGSSERNISAVISQTEAIKGLRAVHSAFYLSPQTLSIGLIGTGRIGSTFLRQLGARAEALRSQRNIELRMRGIMNSRTMLLHDSQIDLSSWDAALDQSVEAAQLDRFVEHINTDHLPHAVIIDATSSDVLPQHYAEWMARGIDIVTPNKRGNSGSLKLYQTLRDTARVQHRYYLYETTVGAGLPVLHTLKELIETGDEVLRIEGVLSGTLSYIFNSFDGTRPFSEVVRDAQVRGYTEPDPRDDLTGMDVARKLVILAREMGVELELADVRVESLVPAHLTSRSAAEFMDELVCNDISMADLIATAAVRGEILRYVGAVDCDGQASVQLSAYPADHPFASLSGSDNIVMFKTARYDSQPMIVRGPGAGPEVTAGGVFADLLRLASFLGAPM